MNTIAARARIRQLAAHAQEVVDDNSLSYDQRSQIIDGIEVEVKAIQKQVDSHEKMAANLKARVQAAPLSKRGSGGAYQTFTAHTGQKAVVGAVPTLTADDVNLPHLKDAIDHGAGYRFTVRAKSAPTVTSVGSVSEGMPPEFLGMVPPNYEATRIADVLPAGQVHAPAVEYVRWISSGGTAGVVAAGQEKPWLTPQLSQEVCRASKIAVGVSLETESLQDYSGFADFASSVLMAEVALAEDAEILSGDGTGEHMRGILHDPDVLKLAKGAETYFDTIEMAIDQMRIGAAKVDPDVMILNPVTRGLLRRQKDSMGRYLAVDPAEGSLGKLWGVQLVVTTACPAGTAVLFNRGEFATLGIRDGLTVQTNYNADDFRRNKLSLIAEVRELLAIVRPAAGIVVTGLTEG